MKRMVWEESLGPEQAQAVMDVKEELAGMFGLKGLEGALEDEVILYLDTLANAGSFPLKGQVPLFGVGQFPPQYEREIGELALDVLEKTQEVCEKHGIRPTVDLTWYQLVELTADTLQLVVNRQMQYLREVEGD